MSFSRNTSQVIDYRRIAAVRRTGSLDQELYADFDELRRARQDRPRDGGVRHHRGQRTTLLSQLGIDPGVTDAIAFYRETLRDT